MAGFDPHAYAASDNNDEESAPPEFDPNAYLSEDQKPGLLKKAGDAVISGLNKLDSYTGAPVRSAISAAQNANTPSQIPALAAGAFSKQFGQDPSLAPSGQDIVERAGIEKGSTAAKVAGFGMDMASNPTSYVPIGDIISGAAKGVGSAVGIGARAVESASDGAPIANAAKEITDLAPSQPGVISKAVGNTSNVLTGVDKGIASNYASNVDRMNQIISHYTGPEGYSEADHAADIRNHWRDIVQDTRKSMNGKISAALNTPEASIQDINAKPIMDTLEDAYDKAHPVTQSKDRDAIQGLVGTLKQMTDDNGNISLKDLHAFKMYAQDMATPAYDGGGNAIFPNGQFAARAAKNGAGSARQVLIEEAPKSVSNAEATLARLHDVEDNMNANLLKPDSQIHALNRAGMNPGGTDARVLQNLKQITGYDFNQDAKDFATARTFSKPEFLPKDSTGKSLARMAIGAGGGYLASQVLPIDPKYAALIGAGLASPGALKAGLNTVNLAGKAAMAPVDAAAAAPRALYGAMTSPVGQYAIDLGAKGALASPALSQSGSASSIPQNIAKKAQANRTPAKGKGYAEGGPVIDPDKAKAVQAGFFGALGGGKMPSPPKPDRSQDSANYAFGGGPVPGRAKVAGNSAKNDTVRARLSPGEIVLPRSVTQAKNAPEAAAKFVSDHLKKSMGPDKWANDGIQKLGIKDHALASQLMQSPKGKQLLIQASDLKPGSKAMQGIMNEIQKGFGGK